MSSATYNLGELEHVYDRQNLKLTNNGFIRISSPQASEFPFSLHFRDLETLVSSKVWIAGGNQLQIEIHISFDDIEISGQENFDVTEELGMVLCNAEIWSQLNLNASLSLPESPIDKEPSLKRILITLTGQPSSHMNVQPPAGVPSARLESVSFTMKLSTCRRTRLPMKERKHLAMREGNVNESQTRKPYDGRESLDRRRDLPCRSYILVPMIGEDAQTEHRTKSGPLIGSNELPSASWHTVSGTISTTRSLDSMSATKPLQSAKACTPSFKTSTPHSEYSTHKVDLEELFKIVNASLHIMVCDRRPAKAGGIILSSDEGYPKLAALSPALFSPGYARAISRCEPLLSTISHTMSSIYCRTRSLGLKRKMEQLLDMATDRYIQEEGPSCEHTESRSSNLTSAVNARLWFLIQRRSNDPTSSAKIKAFGVPKEALKLAHASEMMLDESLMEERDEEAMFDSQDTLLAEDFGQAQEVFEQDAMDWEDPEDDLLLDDETLVGDQIVEQDYLWKELDEGQDLFGASQRRFESTTERANANQEYDEPLEDGDEEILEDQIIDDHQDYPTIEQLGSNRWHDELLEDTMMSMTS
ncbi:hypothetical protein JMJ35_002835 [Cladonia borealis]|uniref:Uncharacterized protein n=1 Tax=Cladonia borealis TaxID=184061 RepID=A0AA39R3I5_9LECA|nr:hypothetical protein JMJ35_002835 [Cladonia borealis]